MFFLDLFQANLKTSFIGRRAEYLRFTNSTNEDAWEFCEEGSTEGTLIITDDQRKGKGRRGNDWNSSPGKGLTFSLLLKPKLKMDQLGLLPLLTGIAVAQGINSLTALEIGLKWPNDIMAGAKKTGGILIESKSTPNGLAVVIGVGVNINEEEYDFPDELQNSATSLLIYGGKSLQREPILAGILNKFEALYVDNFDKVPRLWLKQCVHIKDTVTFHDGAQFHSGVFQGINENGQALIQADNSTSTYSAGVVEL